MHALQTQTLISGEDHDQCAAKQARPKASLAFIMKKLGDMSIPSVCLKLE